MVKMNHEILKFDIWKYTQSIKLRILSETNSEKLFKA